MAITTDIRTGLGRMGEEAAAKFLIRKGWKILTRNFRTRFGEIDLVCRDKNVTVFVEVKSKTGYRFGKPEDMFTREKCGRVRRMAEIYPGGKNELCRIDMVAVIFDQSGRVAEIRHYQNAGELTE